MPGRVRFNARSALERKALAERGKPDLVLALALVHHIAMSANVPVREFVDWLASLKGAVKIERKAMAGASPISPRTRSGWRSASSTATLPPRRLPPMTARSMPSSSSRPASQAEKNCAS